MEKGEKEMATHSSSLAWKIPWTEEPGGLQLVHGVAESAMTELISTAPPAWLFPSNPWLGGELKIHSI